MSLLLFSSGTGGGEKKTFVYSLKDIQKMKQCISHIFEQFDFRDNKGIIINNLPAFPNMGYHCAREFDEMSELPMVHTGGLLSEETILKIINNNDVVLYFGQSADTKNILFETNKHIHSICIANGCNYMDRELFKNRCDDFRMTYGFSEAKMAWLSNKELTGYVVYRDSGKSFKVEDSELVLYCVDYPEGYKTGDLGKIIYEDYEKQIIGIDITRKDGVNKSYSCSNKII